MLYPKVKPQLQKKKKNVHRKLKRAER